MTSEPPLQIRVRARATTDLDDLVVLRNRPAAIYGTLHLPYSPSELTRERLGVREPGSYFLVAEVDGTVVGELGLHVQQNPRRRHAATFGMSVHDAFHRRGVGAALMAAMIELADRWLQVQRIELQVYVDNAAAIALYRKFDFEVEGTLRRFAFRDGAYIDALSMARCTH